VRWAAKLGLRHSSAAYLKAVKAKLPATTEARNLYDALVRPIPEAPQKQSLIIVRDGQLHLVPFDGLRDVSGRYVAENQKRSSIHLPQPHFTC